jgi:uncharacterized membrane protein YkvA (DUF1232 family)
MSNENKNRKLTKIQQNPGLFSGMSRTLRLVLHLLVDRRVNFLLKLLPVGTLVYMFSPLDAVIPFIDDAVILGLGTYVFIELCPQDVVEEHKARLAGYSEPSAASKEDQEVVDTTFTEIDKE